ncbi:MAG TPA: sulfatase-like hydrolase/transferase [Vicingaceae bacterium]|nr:sulfatase-like hydrolase/transferase [Vicingaceae bacterium]
MPFTRHLIKYSYLFLLYPIVVLSIVVTSNTGKSFTPERIIFLHLLLYFVAYFFTNKKLSTLYVRFIYITTLLLAFFEAAYVSIYKERITTSTAFILLETNFSETKEYLYEYFTLGIFLLALIFLIPSVFILIGVKKAIQQYTFKSAFKAIFEDIRTLVIFIESLWLKTQHKAWKKWLIGVVLLVLGTVIYLKSNHHKYHAAFQLFSGYEKYQQEVEKYKAFFSDSEKSSYLKTVQKNKNDDKETLIITIGESTTKHHLGIYGYHRNTTPNLAKINDELVVFNDVISPHTHTIPALEKVLTFGTTNNPSDKELGSLVQLVKAAGYKTYWISNQIPVGINETMVTMLSKAADYSYFTNLGGEKELHSLDERVLPIIKKALSDKSAKKVIFVHLLGTHTQYKNRYPKSFNQFKDAPSTPFGTQQAFDAINQYDNAVLYNDFVISEIISLLKSNATPNEKQQMIYFSDHGEDVYQTVDFNGHSESIGSYPMFEIPFVFWSNNKNKLEKYKPFADRKYMTDDFIYSVADLLNITFEGMQSENSIFHPTFQTKQRIVKQHIDFDTEIKPAP